MINEITQEVEMRRPKSRPVSRKSDSASGPVVDQPPSGESWETESWGKRSQTPLSRILVGVDVQGKHHHALNEALALAKLTLGASLDIVWAPPTFTVVTEPGITTDIQNLDPMDLLKEHVVRILEGHQESLADAEVSIRLHLVHGSPAQALAHLAFVLGSDMIVVGAHEKKMLASWLIGSTAKKLVEDAPCPVLVARSKAADAVPKVEAPSTIATKRKIGLPHRYHEVSRNVAARENMPLLFPVPR